VGKRSRRRPGPPLTTRTHPWEKNETKTRGEKHQNRLETALRAGDRELAKLQAIVDDARAAIGGERGGGGVTTGGGATQARARAEVLGAEDDGEAAAAAAAAAMAAARSIWHEVAELDRRIEVVLHALVEVGRLTAVEVGGMV
jgi:hypothetical protein